MMLSWLTNYSWQMQKEFTPVTPSGRVHSSRVSELAKKLGLPGCKAFGQKGPDDFARISGCLRLVREGAMRIQVLSEGLRVT